MMRTMARNAFLVVAVDVCSGGASGSRELAEYNPGSVEVKEVHMVLSSHFDAGCKVSAVLAIARSSARQRGLRGR